MSLESKRPVTEVRRMRLRDADAVAALCALLGYPTAVQDIRDRFEVIHGDSDHALLVACRSQLSGQKVIGWVHVYGRRLVEVEPHAEIGGLVVADTHRVQGVGRALIAEAEQWALAQGYTEVVLRSPHGPLASPPLL